MHVLLFLCAVIVSAAPSRPIQIRDYRSLVGISNPEVSPEGKRIAFVKTVHDFSADKDVTTICLLDSRTRAVRQLTNPGEFASAPRWAKDGLRIAYLSNPTGNSAQVYEIPAGGGSRRQITRAKNGVQQFCWNPSGTKLAFVTQDDDPNQEALKRHDDLFDIGDDGVLTASRPLPYHIWITSAKGGAAKRLTHGSWSVLETAAPFAGAPSDPSWSPDGRWIAFARQANADDSDSDLSQIAAVNVGTGQVKLLTDRQSYEYQPIFSPVSDTIAYLRCHDAPLSVSDVFTVTVDGKNEDLSTGLDRDVTNLSWLADGKGVVAMYNSETFGRACVLRSGGAPTGLNLGRRTVSDIAGGNEKLAFVASNSQKGPELYEFTALSVTPRQLTHFNDHFASFEYGRQEDIRWKAPDGQASDGILTYPVGYQDGKKYPLLLFIHGGPEAAATDQFLQNEGGLLRETMAGKGYFVFEPNYRGSDNLGNAHEQAIFKNPGEGPASDVISGVEQLISQGLVDSSRISICGHSYGGYMTAWLISHDHRWKSACVLDGAVDLTEEYSFSSDGNLAWMRDSLGGSPSDEASADLYRTGSPVTYAADITTPTLIMSGTSDETVPITESYRLYHTLKDRHVPVRFVGVPGAHHMPTDPVRYERFWEIAQEWILEHDKY